MGDPLFSYEQFTGAGGWDSGRYSVERSVEDRLMADGYSRNLEERAFMFLILRLGRDLMPKKPGWEKEEKNRYCVP